eukprot:Lankesteria_metandrocarpae@DN8376_c0_g1_i1.p1
MKFAHLAEGALRERLALSIGQLTEVLQNFDNFDNCTIANLESHALYKNCSLYTCRSPKRSVLRGRCSMDLISKLSKEEVNNAFESRSRLNFRSLVEKSALKCSTREAEDTEEWCTAFSPLS